MMKKEKYIANRRNPGVKKETFLNIPHKWIPYVQNISFLLFL